MTTHRLVDAKTIGEVFLAAYDLLAYTDRLTVAEWADGILSDAAERTSGCNTVGCGKPLVAGRCTDHGFQRPT